MPAKTCPHCAFYYPLDEDHGECRRRPPVAAPEWHLSRYGRKGDAFEGNFPVIYGPAEMWCGEWEHHGRPPAEPAGGTDD